MKFSIRHFLILFTLGLMLAFGSVVPGYSQTGLGSQSFPVSSGETVLHSSEDLSSEDLSSENVSSENVSSESLFERGRSHYNAAEWEAAISLWQAALEQSNLSELQQATIWSYLGQAQSKLGKFAEGEQAIAQSLQILQRLPESPNQAHPNQARLLAQTLNAKGQIAFLQGQAETALLSWEQSTDLYRSLDYAAGITGSLINQSRAMETLGYHRRACQTLLLAIDPKRQSLKEQSCRFFESAALESVIAALEQQPDTAVTVLGLRSLGNLLRLTGQLTQSQQLLSHSLSLAREQQDPQQQSLSLLSLANVEQALYRQAAYRYSQSPSSELEAVLISQVEKAIAHYTEAERLAQSSLQTSSQPPLLFSQAATEHLALLVAIQQTSAQQTPEITHLFPNLSAQLQRQLSTVSALPESPLSRAAIYTQINLAQSYIDLLPTPLAPNPTDIAALLRQTQQQARTLKDNEAQSYATGTLGHLYERLAPQQPDYWQQAQQLTEDALQQSQAAQADHITYRWQWQLGRIQAALQANEPAISSYQAAVQTLQALRQDLVAVESETQFSFRDNVEPLYRELVTLRLKTLTNEPPSQQNLSQAIQNIDALQVTELENFLSCNLTQTFQLSEPQTASTTAILYPILLPDQLVVIARLPGLATLHFHRISIAESNVTQTLFELRQQAENRFLSDEFWQQSKQVYDWLIRPIHPLLQQQQVHTLIFVSDGSLRNVPMAVLHDGQRFLVEDYAIALSPGLQLPEARPLSQVSLSAIAYGLSQIRSDFQPHQGFSPLTNVEAELSSIKQQLSSRQFLDQDFTTENLAALGDRFSAPIVHLATHGQFSSNPQDTYLLAWDRRITLEDFGQVLQSQSMPTADDIELLILSACRTASGDSRATLGLAGLAIQSGARSTLASLWFVDDLSTAEFMAELYQTLAASADSISQTISRAELLRQAQLELLHTPGYEAPFYWAPYVLVGNWS